MTAIQAVVCNCSICRKKGILHYIVGRDDLRVRGMEALAEYRFNTGVARHLFCRTCGIHPFYVPRSHPEGWDVNLHCLDRDVTEELDLVHFEGQRWEEDIDRLRSTT